MFLFFSNRLGCLGSIVVSLLATVLLLFLFGVDPNDQRESDVPWKNHGLPLSASTTP